MKYKDINLTNKLGYSEALSNMCGYWPSAASVMDIKDAVEDASDAKDLCLRLSKMDLLKKTWVVDRTTDTYIRLRHKDPLGNITYLVIKISDEQQKIDRLEEIIGELFGWAYNVNDDQGVRDAIAAAHLTKKEIKELELESYYEEE